MQKKIWEGIDPKIQGMILAEFKMAGIDFENDFIQDTPENEVETTTSSPWLTREEAANYVKSSKDSIDNWLRLGHVQFLKTSEGRPGRILIDKASLEKFLRSKIVKHKKRNRNIAHSVPGGYRVQRKQN